MLNKLKKWFPFIKISSYRDHDGIAWLFNKYGILFYDFSKRQYKINLRWPNKFPDWKKIGSEFLDIFNTIYIKLTKTYVK